MAEVFHWAVIVVLVAAAAAVVYAAARLAARWCPKLRRLRLPWWIRHPALAVWAQLTWRSTCRRLGLVSRDRQVRSAAEKRPRKAHHPIGLALPTRHGITVRASTVAGVDRLAVDQQAEHFRNHWRVARVSIAQPRPGRLVLRGLRQDPLLRQLAPGAAPAGTYGGANPSRLWLGIGEDGQHRFLELANVSGLVVAGVPGAGKSVELASFLMQWCPSPAVQPSTLDGKGGSEFEEFADRCFLSGGLDLDDAISHLETLAGIMQTRLASVRDYTGGRKNIWSVGVSPEWPLLPLIIDECQRYLDLTAVKGDKEAEKRIIRCIALVADLMRRGRSVGMFTVVASQKVTADSCPSVVRDNAPVAMSFALKTADAAVAALGSDIRQYPSFSPVMFLDRAYAGCAVITMRNGNDPFTRLRAPLVDEDQAAAAVFASAHLRKDPRDSMPVVVPDDASVLTS